MILCAAFKLKTWSIKTCLNLLTPCRKLLINASCSADEQSPMIRAAFEFLL